MHSAQWAGLERFGLISARGVVAVMERLSCFPLENASAEELECVWSDADVIRYTGIPKPCTPEQIEARRQKLAQLDAFAVRLDGELIGVVGCPCMEDGMPVYGLFYQFRKSVWGQGYATQAVQWLLDYMGRTYQRPTIIADVLTANVASEKILRHFGFACQMEETILRYGETTLFRRYCLTLA